MIRAYVRLMGEGTLVFGPTRDIALGNDPWAHNQARQRSQALPTLVSWARSVEVHGRHSRGFPRGRQAWGVPSAPARKHTHEDMDKMESLNHIRTNRDFYLFMISLGDRYKTIQRSLEEYLRCLWRLLSLYRDADGVSVTTFAALLAEAFTSEPAFFDDRWRHRPVPGDEEDSYEAVEALLLGQVVDLREMEEAGTLADDLRYFGAKAPRGSDWYNFDPCTYLECGAAGTLGGWGECDDSEDLPIRRAPDDTDSEGAGPASVPAKAKEPPTPLSWLGWAEVFSFLWLGQNYE